MIDIRTIENSHLLIDRINQSISSGQIKAWLVDSDGDYTRSMEPWKERAWMRCRFDETDPTHLMFIIIEPKNQKLSKATYGVYHGRFAEMLLTHFDVLISRLEITPLLAPSDIFSMDE